MIFGYIANYTTMNTDAYKAKANIIKALGHPSRRELQELVGSDLSTVSKHLAILRNAGIVSDRKQGQWVYYRLRTPCVTVLLDCIEAICKDPLNGPRPGEVSANASDAVILLWFIFGYYPK